MNTTIVFGSIAIASSQVAGAGEIAARLRDALNHIDKERLIAAPDCGLMMLSRELAMTKLSNMCEAAQSV